MSMRYCLSPDGKHTDGMAWFEPEHGERYCPAHRDQPKPRVRLVDGRWVPVEPSEVAPQ